MTDWKQFLIKHGQSADNIDAEKMLELYLDEMKKGLSDSSSLPMIPTYLQNVDRSAIKDGKRILIDAGGTNFRSALGYFENGKPVIEQLRKTAMPAIDRELSAKEFYAQIASNIAYLLEDGGDVGFCFSYQVNMDKDIDGSVVMFSKEVKAPQVIGTRVGAETLRAAAELNAKPRKIAILNDTVATLLGGMACSTKPYSAYIGYIYGTGTNLCYFEDTVNITKVEGLAEGKMIINTESGGFDKFRQGDFDRMVADATAAPKKQLFEKMTSGRYLADVIYRAFEGAVAEGVFTQPVELHPFELKDVSAFMDGGELDAMFACQSDREIARHICRELIDRASLMGAIINAGAAIASCTDKSLPVAVVCEGTTFNKLPGYRSGFEKHLAELLGKRKISFEIVQGEELNLIGTLMSTMAL